MNAPETTEQGSCGGLSAAPAQASGLVERPRLTSGQRVLLIRLGGFGDVVFTLPAVSLLRSTFPDARFSFLVYHEFASLLEGFPGIDQVVTLNRANYRKLNPVAICAQTASLLGAVIRGHFALTVDFQGFGETAFLSWLTRAAHRWGCVYRPGRKWAYTRGVWRPAGLHPIDYHLDLLRQAGGLVSGSMHNEFIVPEQELFRARDFFAAHHLDLQKPTLFIQPFTSSDLKTWPLAHYLKTAQLWQSRGLQILFGGGPNEQAALAPARQAGFAVAAGASPLLSAGLVKLSTLVLGGDTGLLHLAVALGKRVVMIMRYAHPGACFPFGHPDWTVLPTPHLHVPTVPIDDVNQACTRALLELGVYR